MDDFFEKIIPGKCECGELPTSESVIAWNLIEKRIFYINEEIEDDTLYFQGEIIRINFEDKDTPVKDRKPIIFLINSNGGLLSVTMGLAATMRMSKTPIITINVGIAYSGGCVLLLAGHKRYALPYSVAMIHTGSSDNSGTFEQVQSQASMYTKIVQQMITFILERTHLSKKEFSKHKKSDWYLVGDEQLKYGIVDEIVDNLFDILGV